ncbi:OmpA family protein [Nocardiopsis sp. EMB25]|uniref:OmpA family protein n=1 Tax=Nocardiopsis sp. EMB25 TaxID=2835867 RepID=UPI00228495A1|nr:OmpA family protein [Nocardiopsis sp. EMB25]MCY9785174.1 OmpA family protein [Nocardiopsis sp. EMB25]
MAGEVLVTVVLLVGPPWLATRLEWPLGQDTTWVWFLQYLRGGSLPDEVVLAFFVVFLWAVWAVHLVIVALDIIAVARGLVPRVGLVRLMWVLVAGGATATSTQTTALAAHTTDAVAEAPTVAATPPAQETSEVGEEAKPGDVFDRTSILAGFGFDSADLTPGMAESLEPTIGLIADFGHSEEPVVVTGHTDPIGDPSYNRGLSEQRAQAVADHLADQLDADVEIQVVGMGAAQPPSHPRASYGEYRRVEISYTLQRTTPAPVPEPSAVSGADATFKTSSEAASAPEREGVGVTTAAEENTVLDLAGVGLVSGAIGAGVGYAAGRRRASATRRKPATGGGSLTGSEDLSAGAVTDDTSLSQENLVRQDAEGLARGVVDEDGYLLVADTVRVNSAGGVAFVGVNAVRVLAALAAGHAPGPVIATRPVATALLTAGTPLGGVQVASDLAHALVVVEAELLTCARDQDERGDEASAPVAIVPPVLVLVEASDLDADKGLPAVLTATSGVLVCALGGTDHVGATVDCGDTHRVRVRTLEGEVTREGALRLWSPPQGREEHEGAPSDKEPPPVMEHTAETEGEAPGQGEEEPEQPQVPASSGEEHPEASDDHERRAESEHAPGPERDATDQVEGSQPKVTIRLFAPHLVCEVNGRDVLTGARTAARTLLSLLALHPNGVSLAEAAQVLAPGAEDDAARKAVHNAVSRLRKPVRDALGTNSPIVLQDKGRYRVQEEFFHVDVWEFAQAYARIKNHRSESEEEDLRRLVGVYKAHLLCDVEGEWIEDSRRHWQMMFADTCVRLARKVPGHEERVELLERVISIDTRNEALYQELMEVYASMGRMDSVHRAYNSLAESLKAVKSQPSQRSRELLENLERGAGATPSTT